jgi:hypothetical protein
MEKLIKGNITHKKNWAKSYKTIHVYGDFLSLKNPFGSIFILCSVLELKTYSTPTDG